MRNRLRQGRPAIRAVDGLMLWIMYNEDRDDGKALREAKREEHLAYLDAHEDVVVLGGALLADNDPTRLGSCFIVNLPDRAAADAFSLEEPFRKAGLFKRTTIARMRKGQFNPRHAPTSAEGD
jgi:uncharacterized protein YciI